MEIWKNKVKHRIECYVLQKEVAVEIFVATGANPVRASVLFLPL